MTATVEEYRAFFLSSKIATILFDTIEVSHPSFSKVYYAVRNANKGLVAKLETGSTITFQHVPMSFETSEVRETLDYSVTIKLGDLGTLLPAELERIATADSWLTKPTIVYRAYASNDLTEPLEVVRLEAEEFTFAKDGTEFLAKAPELNRNQTGTKYRLDRFPMLMGYL